MPKLTLLNKAKIQLWNFLRINAENLTASEAELFFVLTKDKTIQSLLDDGETSKCKDKHDLTH